MLTALVLALSLARMQSGEVIADIQVHGNTLTTDARIVEIAAVTLGDPFDSGVLDAIAQRLRADGSFRSVQVLKRFASVTDLSRISIVIVVDEGPVSVVSGTNGQPQVRRRRGLPLMYLPILDFEDGYGFAYGLRSTLAEPLGRRSRLSIPLSWGGERKAALELDVPLPGGVISRLSGGAAVTRRINPFFEAPDNRLRTWARAERDLGGSLRLGATTGVERLDFIQRSDRVARAGIDATLDTRLDPFLSRNAFYGRVTLDRLWVARAPSLTRTTIETRGYLGLPRQAVLVLGGERRDSSERLPPALRPLLGGITNLRGYRPGYAASDTLVAGSMELRLPLTSPVSVGKLGVSAFIDFGTVYDKGQRLRTQHFEQGVGGAVWIAATVFRLNFAVARGRHGSTRVHFGLNTGF